MLCLRSAAAQNRFDFGQQGIFVPGLLQPLPAGRAGIFQLTAPDDLIGADAVGAEQPGDQLRGRVQLRIGRRDIGEVTDEADGNAARIGRRAVRRSRLRPG